MKIIKFEDIKDNNYFWLYYLSTSFPLAIDAKEDVSLSEYIYENYDCVTSASEWVNSFVQYTDNIIEENDGYVENPTSIIFSVDNEEYTIQYHPGDTLYLYNGSLIASTGPHYDIHKISFQLLQSITNKIDDVQKALLILPIVYINQFEEEKSKNLIHKLIVELPINSEHYDKITDMIVEGLKV